MQAERDRLVREVAVLEQTRDDARRQLASASADSVNASAELRAVRADLRFRLDRLVRAEQDLQAATARAKEIETQLAPLRGLEQTLQQQQQQRDAATQRLQALQAEVAAAEAAAQKGEAELQPRLLAAKARLEAVQKAGKTLAAAEAALAEVVATMAPPAPAPAAAPAATPAQAPPPKKE